jgi:hypothetical protein
MNDKKSGFFSVAKDVFIGKAKNPFDHSIFHNLSSPGSALAPMV